MFSNLRIEKMCVLLYNIFMIKDLDCPYCQFKGFCQSQAISHIQKCPYKRFMPSILNYQAQFLTCQNCSQKYDSEYKLALHTPTCKISKKKLIVNQVSQVISQPLQSYQIQFLTCQNCSKKFDYESELAMHIPICVSILNKTKNSQYTSSTSKINSHLINRPLKSQIQYVQFKTGKVTKQEEQISCSMKDCSFTCYSFQNLLTHHKSHSNKNKGSQKCIFCPFNGHKGQMKNHYQKKHDISFVNGLTVRTLKQKWNLISINATSNRIKNYDVKQELRIQHSTQSCDGIIKIQKDVKQQIQSKELEMPFDVACLCFQHGMFVIALKCLFNIHKNWLRRYFKKYLQRILASAQDQWDEWKRYDIFQNYIEKAIQNGWISQDMCVVDGNPQYHQTLKGFIEKKVRKIKTGEKLYYPGENLYYYYYHLIGSPSYYDASWKYKATSDQIIDQFKRSMPDTEKTKEYRRVKRNAKGQLYVVKKRENIDLQQRQINKLLNNPYLYCFFKPETYEPMKKNEHFRNQVSLGLWVKNQRQNQIMNQLVSQPPKPEPTFQEQEFEKKYIQSLEKEHVPDFRDHNAFVLCQREKNMFGEKKFRDHFDLQGYKLIEVMDEKQKPYLFLEDKSSESIPIQRKRKTKSKSKSESSYKISTRNTKRNQSKGLPHK